MKTYFKLDINFENVEKFVNVKFELKKQNKTMT